MLKDPRWDVEELVKLAKTPRERLAALAKLLRLPMPTDFRFSFGRWYDTPYGGECGTVGCAWGLAHHMWPEEVHRHPGSVATRPADMYSELGVSGVDGNDLFCAHLGIHKIPTPLQVADAIDHYIETGKVEYK